jgi:O-antigen/teichoic acid export membrane protein
MSLGRHSIANLLGVGTPLLVALATIPTYLSHIGPERYGVLAVIMALTGYMGFLDLGLGRAVTQRMASTKDAPAKEHSELLWTALTASFALGAIGGVALWLGADYLFNNVIKISPSNLNEATDSVIWLSISLMFILPSSALIGALHAKARFIEVNIIQALGVSAGLAVPLIVASMGYIELTYLVPATLAMRGLTTVLLFSQCKKYVPLVGKPKIQTAIIKPLLGYGGWISIMSILAPLLVTVDRLVIATLSGARSVTSYTIPYDLVSRAMVVSGSFSNALFPRLAAAEISEGRALATKASATLIAIMTPIVITGMFLSAPFLKIWIGADLANSSKGVAEAILVGVWVNAVVVPHYARYLATQSPKAVAIIYVLELPFYFLLLWQGVSHWGAFGAAVAWSARVLVDTLLILKLNNELMSTIRVICPSLLLIISASAAIYQLSSDSILYALIALALVITSIVKDNVILNKAYLHLINRKNIPA